MTAYRFTEKAAEDLIGVWVYTDDTWGEKQADRYQEEIHSCCEQAANGAAGVRPVPRMSGISSFHCGHHYLFFVREGATTIIIAVFHERMDLMVRLRNRL